MRRRARQCALQILYQLDVGKQLQADSLAQTGEALESVLQEHWASFEPVGEADKEFAARLARGVVRELPAIDARLASVSQHWKLGRMDIVDRNLLRMAAYEILWCPDIPRAASINEAVEIAKKFNGQSSASFINGVLDKLSAEDDANAGNASASTMGTELHDEQDRTTE